VVVGGEEGLVGLAVLLFEVRENGAFGRLILLMEGEVVVGIFVDLFAGSVL
jgi:hypothetical protein